MSENKAQRIRELYEGGGISEVSRGVRDYCVDNLPFIHENYADRRTDNPERWQFMAPHISEYDSVLDIGCAEGYFTKQAAAEGMFALGIDTNTERLRRATDATDFPQGSGFMHYRLDPENINDLPEFDVIFCLTVKHHWERQYGLEKAEDMFETLLEVCNQLVYEPPGDRPLIKDMEGSLDPEDSIPFYRDKLNALYGDSIDIVDQTMVEYRDVQSMRRDPIFIIDTSNR